VEQGKELSSPAGPVGRKSSIGKKEKIAVPAKNWKIIAVLDRQGLGMQSVDANTSETIAVIMPNSGSVKGKGWKSFQSTCEASRAGNGVEFLI
jgi:DNA/RNA endonuclease G (NUC1)